MEKTTYKSLLSNINYNTYNNIKKTITYSTLFLILSQNIIGQVNPDLANPAAIAKNIGMAASVLLYITRGEEHTKDFLETEEYYNLFINNYNKLNKLFSLDNPVEMHTMYHYLLNKGYLSKDHEFTFTAKEARDMKLSGANIMTGKGVCRHITSLFTDILTAQGVKAHSVCVYLSNLSIEIKKIDQPKYTEEELKKMVLNKVKDEEQRKKLLFVIDLLINKYNYNIEIDISEGKNNIFIRTIGNHTITYAFKDSFSYYLDPTNDEIYRMKNNKSLELEHDDISIPITILFNDHKPKEVKEIKDFIRNNYQSIPIDIEEEMIKRVKKLCMENEDIFEQFYKENRELYQDISDKVLIMKKNPLNSLAK